MEERFTKLHVGLIPPFSNIRMWPQQEIIDQLISHYKKFRIYQFFGPTGINYICGLATRYACSTLQRSTEDKKNAVMAYALWLSLIWLIDGFFDKCRLRTSVGDVETLIKIFNYEEVEGNHPIFEIAISLYPIYLDLIAPYRMEFPLAFSNLNKWLMRYLKTLVIPNSLKQTKSEYESWRLDSGAMMCVVWHLILFSGLTLSLEIPEDIFTMTSVVVSYHNDIISYNRDLCQSTPNLVSVCDQDSFEGMIKAIQITDELYARIGREIKSVANFDVLAPIILDILEGSFSWAYAEPRYAVGVEMLRALKSNDRNLFYGLLHDQLPTPGDPKIE